MAEPGPVHSDAADPSDRGASGTGPSDRGASGTGAWVVRAHRRGGSVAAGAAALVKRWRDLSALGEEFPEKDARRVVEAVLDHLRNSDPEGLAAAGRLWGRTHRSVSEMVEYLSLLRVALSGSGIEDPFEMHRAVDLLTGVATGEVMARVERASRTDALTGVGTRRAFDESIQGTLSAAARQGHEVTIVAVDLDGLKSINDTAGHAAGDAALISLVKAFYGALRDEDMVFRLGGDEFVVVLPFTSVDAAEALMRRVGGSDDTPAFTWGAAGFPADASEASVLVGVADQDLYRRRGMQRAPLATSRPSGTPVRLGRSSRWTRWAWIPAAAVLVVSLIATLVSPTTGSHILATDRRHSPTRVPDLPTPEGSQSGAASSSGQGGSNAPGTSAFPATSAGGGYSSNGSASPAQTVGFETSPSSPATAPTGRSSPSTGSSAAPGSGSSGSSGSQGGGAGTSSSPTPATNVGGGLVGAANELLAPLPIVGDGGLLSVLDELLLQQPSTPAGTVNRATVASPTFTAVPVSYSSPGSQGLFGLLQSL